MQRTHLLLSLLAATTLVCTATADEFVIDSHGARPNKFRITARCRNVDTWFSPTIYKTGFFDRVGADIKATPSPDLALGIRGGTVVLLERTGWQSGKYWIIGEAQDLDRMVLLEGVEISGHTEWDMASQAWRVLSNASEVNGLELYQGELLDRSWARDRLLSALRGEIAENASNLEVLTSAVTHFWWDLIDPNDDNHDVDYYQAATRAFYVEPMRKAAAGADPAARKRLATLNRASLEMARKVLSRYTEDTWRPEVYRRSLELAVADLEAIATEL